MKIIGFDSAGMVASVAYVKDGVLIAEYTMNHKKTHSETLLPMLDRIVTDAGISLSEIDAIAVAAGPGSFTGLRIGAATVKGLGLALEKPLVAVPTCEGLSFNLSGASGLVVPIMDARRGQVYTGIYRVRACDDVPKIIMDQKAMAIEELLDRLAGLGEDVIFLGDGVPVFRKVIEETCRVPFSFAPASNALQRAASVAALGERYMLAEGEGTEDGHVFSADDFKPIYLRKSQAEREHEAAAEKRREEDIAFVAGLEREIFPDAWSEETIRDSLKYAYNHVLIISDAGTIRPVVSGAEIADSFVVGEEEQRAGYLIYADPTEEAELHRIAVSKTCRRQGLARKLMDEMFRMLSGDTVFLEVRAENAPAVALYKNSGFQEIDRRRNYYHDPDEDAVIMRKK